MRVLKLPALKDYSVCQGDAERAMTEVNGRTSFLGPMVRSRGPGVMVALSYSRNYLLCNSLKYRY